MQYYKDWWKEKCVFKPISLPMWTVAHCMKFSSWGHETPKTMIFVPFYFKPRLLTRINFIWQIKFHSIKCIWWKASMLAFVQMHLSQWICHKFIIYTSKIYLTYKICQIKFARVNRALLKMFLHICWWWTCKRPISSDYKAVL